jgi:hypothetical protein
MALVAGLAGLAGMAGLAMAVCVMWRPMGSYVERVRQKNQKTSPDQPAKTRPKKHMTDLDPYDPALKYPAEWGLQERIDALKCWRDGRKTNAIYWMKDHEWKFLPGVELVTTKDVTQAQMRQVEWALSDKENTFTALPRWQGLLYSKHGNEHVEQDYHQKTLQWSDLHLTSEQFERGMFWMAKTRRRTYFEWLGGTDLTNAEAFALLAKFAYLIGAKAVTGKGMRRVNRDIAAIRQRRVHRSTAWLALHRAGIHQTAIHKAIFKQAELLW